MCRVFQYLLIVSFSSCLAAYDEQLSIFSTTSPQAFTQFGYGAELATTSGQRLTFAANAHWQPENNSQAARTSIGVSTRLLYNTSLNSQWYPFIGLRYSLPNNQLSSSFGAGFQHEVFDGIGLFSNVGWQPSTQDFALSFGLRFWFERFSSLDSRVRKADPVGAVYIHNGKKRAVAPEQVSAIQPPTNPPKTKPEAQVDTALNAAASTEETIQPKPMMVPEWFVHLGVFRQTSSLEMLANDSRLDSHRENLLPWYDVKKSAYRLLLGPFSETRATVIANQLKQQKLDNFLYQLP